MVEIAVWDIDRAREHYRRSPDLIPRMEAQYERIFRFMDENALLKTKVVDSSGNLVVRQLFTKDFTPTGQKFFSSYGSKWLDSASSTDPVKGPKLLEKYLRDLRASRKR